VRNPAISISDMEIWYQEALVILSFNSRCISKYSAMQRDMAGQQVVRTATGYRSHPHPNMWCCTALLPARTTEQVRCLLEPTLPPGTHTAAGWQQKLKPPWESTQAPIAHFLEKLTQQPWRLEVRSAADYWTCDWGLIFVWIRAFLIELRSDQLNFDEI